MLIVNDEQRMRAGIGSLSKRCQYCSKALAAYPSFSRMMAGWPSTMPRVLPRSRRRSWSISTPSSARLLPITRCLCSRHPKQLPPLIPRYKRRCREYAEPPSPDQRRSSTCSQPTFARSRRLSSSRPSSARHRSVVHLGRWSRSAGGKGQLRVMIRGWGRWYPVESVRIEGAGPQLFGSLCFPLLAYPGLPSTGRMSVDGCDTS